MSKSCWIGLDLDGFRLFSMILDGPWPQRCHLRYFRLKSGQLRFETTAFRTAASRRWQPNFRWLEGETKVYVSVTYTYHIYFALMIYDVFWCFQFEKEQRTWKRRREKAGSHAGHTPVCDHSSFWNSKYGYSIQKSNPNWVDPYHDPSWPFAVGFTNKNEHMSHGVGRPER